MPHPGATQHEHDVSKVQKGPKHCQQEVTFTHPPPPPWLSQFFFFSFLFLFFFVVRAYIPALGQKVTTTFRSVVTSRLSRFQNSDSGLVTLFRAKH